MCANLTIPLHPRSGEHVLSYGKPVSYHALDDNEFVDVLVFMGHQHCAGYAARWLSLLPSLEEFTVFELVDIFSFFHYRR